MDDERERTQPDGVPRPAAGRPVRRVRQTMPADAVWRSTAVAVVVLAVLGSGGMRDSAEGMPLGWQRSVAMTVTGALDRVVNLLSLNRPYDWAAERLGRIQADKDFRFPVTSTSVAPDGATAEAGPSSTTTTLPALRTPTPAAPWRVVIAGDSTADSLGNRLKAAVQDVPTLAVDNEAKVSTGLTRSDYFNWGARAKQLLDEGHPDVMIFMVGANDTQAVLQPDGKVVAGYGTPEWTDAYRTQVAGIMDLAHDGPRRMIWIGEPTVGNPKVNTTVQRVNAIVQEEAAKRPWVTYFDMAAVVAGPGGRFNEYITLPGGKTVRCFAGDSVHLSMACLDYSMQKLVPAIEGLPKA